VRVGSEVSQRNRVRVAVLPLINKSEQFVEVVRTHKSCWATCLIIIQRHIGTTMIYINDIVDIFGSGLTV